jgi:GNAT superfamily N-acetyltransferase
VTARARLSILPACEADASAIALLHTAAAAELTKVHGKGRWSSAVTERSVARDLSHSRGLVVRQGTSIVATVRLTTRRPWAIDPDYFTPAERPVYLREMAVEPSVQRLGIGRRLLARAVALAKKLPADAIRLDAYDATAGAGPFYAKCGFDEVGRVAYRGTPLVYFELVLANKRRRQARSS